MSHAPSKSHPFVRSAAISLLFWALLALAVRRCSAQAPTGVELHHGNATALVRNPSNDTLRVTVALFWGHFAGKQLVLDRPVDALVAPTSFTLAPTERQTVRIRLRERVPVGTTLRLVSTFTPSEAFRPAPGSDRAPVVRFTLVTRVIGKVQVFP